MPVMLPAMPAPTAKLAETHSGHRVIQCGNLNPMSAARGHLMRTCRSPPMRFCTQAGTGLIAQLLVLFSILWRQRRQLRARATAAHLRHEVWTLRDLGGGHVQIRYTSPHRLPVDRRGYQPPAKNRAAHESIGGPI